MYKVVCLPWTISNNGYLPFFTSNVYSLLETDSVVYYMETSIATGPTERMNYITVPYSWLLE